MISGAISNTGWNKAPSEFHLHIKNVYKKDDLMVHMMHRVTSQEYINEPQPFLLQKEKQAFHPLSATSSIINLNKTIKAYLEDF